MIVKYINLANNGIQVRDIEKELIWHYIGGLGLATRLMDEISHNSKLKVYDPETPLIVSVGPLNATGFPSANRTLFYSLSPATNLVSMSLIGGSFGNTLAKTGTQNYVLQECAPGPSILVIDDDLITVVPRKDLWGLTVSQVRAALKTDYPSSKYVVIGPAGEKLIPYASIMGEEGHAAGRSGLGAIMGNKKLKAIVVKGSHHPEIFKNEEYRQFCRLLLRAVRENSYITNVVSPLGTINLVEPMNEAEGLPVLNHRYSTWDRAELLYGNRIKERYYSKNKSCSSCPVACRKIVKIDGHEYEGPEYESLWALGPENGISNYETITRANNLCNEMGLDTITTGVTIAMYQEYTGLKMNESLLLSLINKIGSGEDEGKLLSQATKKLEKVWGVNYGMHVKGLELPAYDPRRFPGMGLAYATSPRGGCHCRGFTVGEELATTEMQAEDIAEMVIRQQNLSCVRDSLITCIFVHGSINLEQHAKALEYTIGLPFTSGWLKMAGENIFNKQRELNVGRDVSMKEDTLPARLLSPINNIFNDSIDAYYRLRGWDIDDKQLKSAKIDININNGKR